MPTLSIIIVTHNSCRYIIPCLTSVGRGTRNVDIQTIVVDNGSTDGTVPALKTFHNVVCIQNRDNVGFARACNQGIKMAHGDFILLLNPDTEVREGAIDFLLEFLRSHPEVGIAGGRLENPNGTLQHSVGRFPTVSNLLFDKVPFINLLLPVYFQRCGSYYKRVQYPDWVAGSFFIMRRNVVDRIGLFDERYFMYMEDVDLCYRARQAGWKTAYAPGAVAVHHDLGKMPENRYNKFIHQRIGLLYFFNTYRTKRDAKRLHGMLRMELKLRRMPSGSLLEKYKKILQRNCV